MTYEVGQIVAWDCPKHRRAYAGRVTSVTARQITVKDTTDRTFTFGAKGYGQGMYGGRWVLRAPTKAESDLVMCALAEERIHDALKRTWSALDSVKRDPKIMEAIADRAALLLKTVKGFVK